jgi:hypothetical protein
LVFNQPDVDAVPRQAAFGRVLCGMEGKYGEEAWAMLEKSVGKLS